MTSVFFELFVPFKVNCWNQLCSNKSAFVIKLGLSYDLSVLTVESLRTFTMFTDTFVIYS